MSRRALASGAAWALPVVSLAALAPLVAASNETVAPTDASAACKYNLQGRKYYRFELVFKNNGTAASTVCLVEGTMAPNGCSTVGMDTRTFAPAGGCQSVGAGRTVTLTANSLTSGCGANGSMSLTYTYTVGSKTFTATASVPFNSVSPC